MKRTRRSVLAALGGATTVGLAGCLGSLGGGSGLESCDIPENGETVSDLPSPVAGNADADVVVKAWEDFACPHCAEYSLNVFPGLKSDYADPGKIRYEQHDFPFLSAKWSWAAASAARGVQETVDDETYFEYAHELFSNQSKYSMDLVQKLATQAGADGCTIRAAAVNETYKPVLEADKSKGKSAGVEGTPAVFVNDQQIGGGSMDEFEQNIRDAIESNL